MIEEPLSKLATASILGSLLALSLIALFWVFRQYQNAVEARVSDQKETNKLAVDWIEKATKMQEATKAADERSVRLITEFEKMRESEHERELRDVERERERDQRERERERERELRTTGAHRPASG